MKNVTSIRRRNSIAEGTADEEYQQAIDGASLGGVAAGDGWFDAIRDRLDRELAVLQEPGAAEKLRDAFEATPAAIASGANDGGRRKG